MGSLSLHLSTLVSTIKARLQCISWEAELWFQWGGDMRPPISGGPSQHPCDFGQSTASTVCSLCMPWPCFSQLLATGILGLWMLSETKKLAPSAQTWPGLDLLSTSLDKLRALDAPDTTARSSTKVSSLSRAALSLPWMSQELMGLCVQ